MRLGEELAGLSVHKTTGSNKLRGLVVHGFAEEGHGVLALGCSVHLLHPVEFPCVPYGLRPVVLESVVSG